MAVALFYKWDRDGRPIRPARPIEDFVYEMRVAFPDATFSWYANKAHYEADYPQDHTPYSYTGWPLPNPYPYVFATDVMHRPARGVDCFELFPYWLAEAKAGRMPWLKYMIWQAKAYSVRNGWNASPSSGHFTHCHLSARTDYLNYRLGSWNVTPEGNLNEAQAAQLEDAHNIVYAMATGRDAAKVHDKDGVLDLAPFWARVAAESTVTVTIGPEDVVAALESVIARIVRAELDKTRLTTGA